jgi:hypothetical protein
MSYITRVKTTGITGIMGTTGTTSNSTSTKGIRMMRANSGKGISGIPIFERSVRSARNARSEGVNIANKCNNDIKLRSKYSDFIFFGCWNNIDCDKEYIYRDIVLDYIHKNESIRQLYIAGDNWYTNKKKINKKNFKVYLTDILMRGYDKLYAMKKEIYIAVGNHDEDKDSNITNPKLQNDCNINTQKYYLKQIKDKAAGLTGAIAEPSLDALYNIAKEGKLTDNYLCKNGVYIYVDNIGVRYNNGNIVIIINTNKFDNYDEGLVYLQSIMLVIDQVKEAQMNNESNEQIFVMGHIPLFSFKKDKKGNDEIKVQDIDKNDHKFRRIILGLFNIFVDNNIIYICADTHNFSILRIKCNDDDNRVLIQITAGSGGADPDLLSTEYINIPMPIIKIKDNIDDNKFKIFGYALNSYGYVKIKTNHDNIEVCYKQIIKDAADETDKYLFNMGSGSGSHASSISTKINEITYQVNRGDMVLGVKEYINPNVIMNIYKNTEICKKNEKQKYGYITSLDRKTACYMKKGKE